MLRELKFSIANHTFWYTYEIPFELPLDSPINNFRIGDYTNYDTKNSIRFNAALLEYRKWKADFEVPSRVMRKLVCRLRLNEVSQQ